MRSPASRMRAASAKGWPKKPAERGQRQTRTPFFLKSTQSSGVGLVRVNGEREAAQRARQIEMGGGPKPRGLEAVQRAVQRPVDPRERAAAVL